MRVVIPNDWNGAFGVSEDIRRLGERAEVSVFQEPAWSQHELLGQLRQADVVVGIRERTRFPEALFAQLPRLKFIAHIGGPDAPHIDIPAATQHGVLISYTSQRGAPGQQDPVVEIIVGMLISLFAQFQAQDRAIREGGWPLFQRRTLVGKTLGIVGLGRIGSNLAAIASSLGMRVLAAGVRLTPERAAAAGVEFRTLPDLFAEADAISINLRLLDETRGIISGDLLRRMKPDAYLINTSRGPVLDQAALVDLLQAGRIGGAALDVYDEEPLPRDHPLRSLDNVLLLGHCGWATDTGYAGMIPRTAEIVQAFLDGHPVNVLNPEAAGAPARE